jgi:hypothetical protein
MRRLLWRISIFIWPTVRGIAAVECLHEVCRWTALSGHDNCHSNNLTRAKLLK